MRTALLQAALAAADAAGTVLRGHFRAPLDADLKADLSPVTVADRQAEAAVRDVLSARFPHHGIIGEEYGADRPGAAQCWVLDPIDGTRAFLTGRPVFATLIALLEDGEPVLGIIDQPVTGERWIGVAGQPTVFRNPLGGAIGTRLCPELAMAELSCTSPELLGDRAAEWQRLAASVRRVSWGGDGYAYGLLALGQIDVIAECGMKLWDWAALVPVIEGAGGQVTDWHGNRLHTDSPGEILALGDPSLTPAAVGRLVGGVKG